MTEQTNRPERILIIGLDAATPRLVERWAGEGRLPNIGRFLAEGAWAPMRSVPNRNSAPAWSTMVTGLNPGKHGIYWFTEDNPEGYDYTFVNGSFRRGKAFWTILSEQGRQVGVLNVPLTFPAEEVNGVFVSGVDSPSADDPRFTHPPELRTEVVEAAGGEYYVHPGLARYVIADQHEEGLERLRRSIDKRAAVARHLMTTRPWDCFMVVFTESDVVSHFFWRQMEDPAPDTPDSQRHAIRDVYAHLDRVVGELVELAGPDSLVVLVSDHGFRADDGHARALPNWLEQLGLLAYRTEERRTGPRQALFKGISRTYRLLDRTLSAEAKHKLSRRLPWLRRRIEVMMSFANVDWSRTLAYTDGKRPEIWVNLRGRQPEGIVAPEEYEAVRDRIIESLTAARCARTGSPLITRVLRREEAYSGPFVDRSPDLIVEWADESTTLHVRYPDGREMKLLKQHLPDDPFDRVLNGGHDPYGIVAFRGPGVRPGRLDAPEIADVAPTVLWLMDAPVPSDVDGRVLSAAFDETLARSEVRQGGSAITEAPAGSGYSEEEEAEIRERLQALGYVE